MKYPGFIIIILATILATSSLAEARGRGGCGQGQGQQSISALPLEDLNETEKEALLLMREEEKLARDVYLTLGLKYDVPVFANIPQSEQRHMDQVGELLARYELEDPIKDDTRGHFTSSEMQKLYDSLVALGNQSLGDALKVGATIEDLDIYDLEKALASGVDNQDVIQVFRNLAKGSRNHMRAFHSQLESQGLDYDAQYISQDELATILSSDWERGPAQGQKGAGRGQGRGNGRGQGRGCCNN